MMAINNEAMKRLAFLEILECIASGDTDALEKAGLSKESIKKLSQATAKDVPGLSRMMTLAISFDPKNLIMDFSRADVASEERRMLEYYVLNHATPAMLRRYFRTLSEKDVHQMRKRLGAQKRGRTPVLDHKTAIKVFNSWERLAKIIPDERQRYIALHKDFPEWPLSSLYSAINEVGEP